MDPDETLRMMRRLQERATRGEDVRRSERELRWLFRELDEWLSKGGFLPADWQRPYVVDVQPEGNGEYSLDWSNGTVTSVSTTERGE